MHTPLVSSFRSRLSTVHALLLGVALLSAGACNDDDTVAPRARVNLPRIIITPGSVTLAPGATQQFAAEVRDGATDAVISGQTVTWASRDTLIARVSATGLVTVVGAGTAGITASYNNAVRVASVVVLGPVVSVGVTAGASSLTVGATTQVNVSAIDANGVPQPRVVTYTSSAATVATVSSTGLVTAVGAGTATITATSEGKSGTVNLTVLAPIPVVVTPATSFIAQGGTQQLTVVLRDPVTGAILTGQTITYTTSAATVATVSATGLVTVVGGGTATITATSSGRSASATVTNVLTSGTAVTIGGPLNSSLSYYVNVPAGATRLTITLANANSDDADIEVYAPGGTTPVCVSENAASNETCVVNAPLSTGLYRIRVLGFTVYSNVTLRATVLP